MSTFSPVLAMRSLLTFIVLIVSFVYLMAPATLAENAQNSSQVDMLLSANRAGQVGQTVKTPAPSRHWSTRKKIIVAGVAACLIATAIAVPVGVHTHHEHERRKRARQALSNYLMQNAQAYSVAGQINNQIATDLQQEKTIQNLLSRGNLNPAQTANLRSQLTQLQGTVSGLRSELNKDILNDVIETATFAKSVPPNVIATNRALLSQLTATNFFGQNTPAIAAQEAQYAEMWAQDVSLMAGLH